MGKWSPIKKLDIIYKTFRHELQDYLFVCSIWLNMKFRIVKFFSFFNFRDGIWQSKNLCHLSPLGAQQNILYKESNASFMGFGLWWKLCESKMNPKFILNCAIQAFERFPWNMSTPFNYPRIIVTLISLHETKEGAPKNLKLELSHTWDFITKVHFLY
jgi:hypothetical protein